MDQAGNEPAQGAEVGRSVAILLTSGVFAEGDVENPMLAVFDAPVFANGIAQFLGPRRQATDVHSVFPGFLSVLEDVGRGNHERLQVTPFVLLRMVGRDFDRVA